MGDEPLGPLLFTSLGPPGKVRVETTKYQGRGGQTAGVAGKAPSGWETSSRG